MPLSPTQLSELGYHLVPWKNRLADERKPIVSGFLDNKPSPTTIAQWEAKYTECDWAIIPMDHAVVDIEMKNGKNGEQDLLDLFPDVDWSIYPQTKTYSGGRHIWVRLPEGWTKKGGINIAPGIEIKCRTGSAHIPPSDGYVWINELTEYDIPVGPDELWDAWRNARPASVAKYDATEIIACGARHSFLCSIAGTMRNTGLGEEELILALRLVANKRCEKPEEISDEEIAGIAKSYAEKDADSFELRLAHSEPAAVSVEKFFSRQVQPMVEPIEHTDPTVPALTDKQLRPTALIAEWVDWVLEGANRRQPELTLLAACVGLGVCIGRKLTWNNTHANLYAMALASSGSGKNDPLGSISKVLQAAGAEDLIGASDIGSDAGLIEQIASKPDIVWAIDEFALILENLNKPNCPGYVTYIAKYLLALHSCDPYRGKALKGTEPVIIPSPFPCLYTCTQPKVFLGAYNDKMSDSGLLGRFTVFLGDNLPRANPRTVRRPPPETLVSGIKLARDSTRNFFKAVGETRPTVEIQCDEDTMKHYFDRYNEVEDYVQKYKDGIEGTLAARTMEKANKFALIHAWSLNPAEPRMTKESIDWGVEIAQYANKCMISMLSSRIVNVQDEHTKFVFDYLESRKSKGATTGEIAARCSRIERTRRAAILQDLIDAGKVVCLTTKGLRGPTGSRYYAVNHTPNKELK